LRDGINPLKLLGFKRFCRFFEFPNVLWTLEVKWLPIRLHGVGYEELCGLFGRISPEMFIKRNFVSG
jgi:hypothetical protein